MSRDRYITIKDERWRLRYVTRLKNRDGDELAGDCDHPKTPNRVIRIVKGQEEFEELSTLIHEIYHAAHPDHKEEHVYQWSDDVARILIAEGWGRVNRRTKAP